MALSISSAAPRLSLMPQFHPSLHNFHSPRLRGEAPAPFCLHSSAFQRFAVPLLSSRSLPRNLFQKHKSPRGLLGCHAGLFQTLNALKRRKLLSGLERSEITVRALRSAPSFRLSSDAAPSRVLPDRGRQTPRGRGTPPLLPLLPGSEGGVKRSRGF